MTKTSEKIDWGLFAITFFLGWLGIDKFYYFKSFKLAWKFAIVKLAFTFVFVGILWNIWDLIMILLKRYQVDAREYWA